MDTPPVLHFLCGKAGAGKSTLAVSLSQSDGALLISEDIWLSRLFSDRMNTFDDYRVFSARLKTVIGPLVVDLLKSGQSVVLDFPANTKVTRAWFRTVFEKAGSAHILHFVDTANEECIQRIEKRNLERPEGSHHLSVDDFLHITSFFEAPDALEAFTVRVYQV
jgi:predicted kinase